MTVAYFANLLGTGIVIGLMAGIWKTNARRWQRLACAYEAHPESEPATANSQRMQTVILTGGAVGWNSYKGIITVSVTSDGILFQLMGPFSFFHPPLLISYRDVHVEPKQWYLFGESFQMTFASVKDVQMIIHSELFEWIEQESHRLDVEFTSHHPDDFQDATSHEPLQLRKIQEPRMEPRTNTDGMTAGRV